MTNESNNVNQPLTIDDIINEIKQKSPNGDYIYRGERQPHYKVSSALYRDYFEREDTNIDIEGFDLRDVQKEMLRFAKKHIGEPTKNLSHIPADIRDVRTMNIIELTIIETLRRSIEKDEEAEEVEILTELQHYGGKTNLIDFTTDYLIAIFFACAGHPKENGRVILLQKTDEIEDMIIRPRNPRHRVIAQKSVFLHPPKGFIDVSEDNKVVIPKDLKQWLLKYLREYHNISAETIYNDIHGFIRNQDIHRSAYIEFYQGLTRQYKGFNAETLSERQQEHELAINYYNRAIEMNPELDIAYGNRAECWLHLEEWEKAKEDFITANKMGLDVIDSFRNDYYENVADFEEKTGIQLPPEIAAMVGN